MGSIKDCLEINLWGKKELNFAKYVVICKHFLELQVYDLVEFSELSMVTNASNSLNILVDLTWWSGHGTWAWKKRVFC